MKIPKWSELTTREKWLAGTALLFADLFIGSIVARLLDGHDLNWEAISALVAVVALPLAFIGYMDNRNGQRLEHRPYIRLAVQDLIVEPRMPITFNVQPYNYGRTPAHKLSIQGRAEYVSQGANFDADLVEFSAPAQQYTSIHPGQEDDTHVQCPTGLILQSADIAAIPASMTLCLCISCRYVDAMGGKYETRSTSYINRVGNEGFEMAHTPYGNWAT